MRRFARTRGDLRRRGQLIGDADILIAPTAIHHGLILLTRNLRHFERIGDLRLHQATKAHGAKLIDFEQILPLLVQAGAKERLVLSLEIGRSGLGDVSANQHTYLADASADLHG